MFGSAARKELEQANLQLLQSRYSETQAQARIVELESQLADAGMMRQEAQTRLETYEELVKHLDQFGVSIGLSQQSLARLAETMKAERAKVVESSGVTEVSRNEIGTISSNLSDLSARGPCGT